MCMWIAWVSDMWVSDMSNSRCYVRRRRVVTGTVFIAAHVWPMEHLSGPTRRVFQWVRRGGRSGGDAVGFGGAVGARETVRSVMRDAENGRGAGKV